MENTADWRTESRTVYSNDFKLRIVELASQPDANVAKIARENGVAHNLIFKWLRMWQNEGRVSRRRHCCKVSDEVAFCFIERPYISKTLLTRRISPRGSPSSGSGFSCHVEFVCSPCTSWSLCLLYRIA